MSRVAAASLFSLAAATIDESAASADDVRRAFDIATALTNFVLTREVQGPLGGEEPIDTQELIREHGRRALQAMRHRLGLEEGAAATDPTWANHTLNLWSARNRDVVGDREAAVTRLLSPPAA